MEGLGKHLLLELCGCTTEKLDDPEFVKKVMLSAAEAAGATVLNVFVHKFTPQGVSVNLTIEESHISIHTWPEFRKAAADIFTCGSTMKPEKAMQIIVESLDCEECTVTELTRGLCPPTIRQYTVLRPLPVLPKPEEVISVPSIFDCFD